MNLELRLLAFGAGSALALAIFPATATAQTSGEGCTTFQMLQHKCGKKKSHQASKHESKQKTKFPNATRKEPSNLSVSSSKEAKTLNAGLAAANQGDVATAKKDLQPIADSSSSAYARALATLGLAQAKYHSGDIKGAITLQQRALNSGALDNNSYFQGLETLAQMDIANEDYAGALKALDTWNKESGAQSADIYALQGNAYYRLQKYPQAVAAIKKAKSLSTKPQPSWDQIEVASYFAMDKYDAAAKLAEAALAKDPNNTALLQNVIAIYLNAHENKKALALLERERKKGMIKTQTDYMNMAKMYDNMGQSSSKPKVDAMKAVGVLKEGMSKGIIKPGYASYKLLGDSYAIAGNYKQAVIAYGKASPDAKNGGVDFVRGQLLEDLGRHKDAKAALKQAIARGGFKRMGAAYLTLGNAEVALKERSAAIAAYKHAEKDQETRAEARRMLKKLGHK